VSGRRKEPECSGGRQHRWDTRVNLGWFCDNTPVEECDCGLLRIGRLVGGERGTAYDWTYYSRLKDQ